MPQTPHEFIDGLFSLDHNRQDNCFLCVVHPHSERVEFAQLSDDESTTTIGGPRQSIFGWVDNLELE